MQDVIRQLYVPTGTLQTSGEVFDLNTSANNYKMGFYNPSDFTALSSASGVTELIAAFGSGDSKLGTFKTSKIKTSNIISFEGYAPDTTVEQQITYIGFDEINDSKSPSLGCDEEYYATFKIWEGYSAGIYQPLIQDSIRIKTACCSDCSTNCDSLDCKEYFTKAAADINANPLLSKYITASVVSKCTGSADTTVFALTLPDPGTNVGGVSDFSYTYTGTYTNGTYTGVTGTASGSGASAEFTAVVLSNVITLTLTTAGTGYVVGETIVISSGITGLSSPAEDVTVTVVTTTGPEGVLLEAVQTAYSAYVDDVNTDIVITADTDGDQDSNSTGNIRIELTPSAGVVLADLNAFEGIAWEEVTLTAGTETCVCGLKIVGNALDEFGNTCIPDAVPYVANLVRFKVAVHPGPGSTMDFDLEDECSPWFITTTQEIKFPVGEGKAMAELERHYFRNNLPEVIQRGYYWSPIFNEASSNFLHVDTSKTYFQYILKYYDPSSQGFDNKDRHVHELMILVPTDNTTLANSVEGFLSTFTGTTVNIA